MFVLRVEARRRYGFCFSEFGQIDRSNQWLSVCAAVVMVMERRCGIYGHVEFDLGQKVYVDMPALKALESCNELLVRNAFKNCGARKRKSLESRFNEA